MGHSPMRGVSVDRTARTTAGSHRIPVRGGRFASHGGRPLEDMPKVFRQLAQATSNIPPALVPRLANEVRREVARQGGRYKLRGSNGKPVKLSATTQAARTGKAVSRYSRFVVGVPAGFWRIVEEGSSKHLIAGRHRRRGGRFTAIGASNQFIRDAERGNDSFNHGSPVNYLGGKKGDSDGWAQFVMHPGHGPIGRPWRKAMNRSGGIVTRVHAEYSREQLIKAFFR